MQTRQKVDPLDFLADASRILASSVEVSATLPRVADFCIQQIADYCAIYASSADGSAVTLVEAAPEPGVHLQAADPSALPTILREHGFDSVASATIGGRTVQGTLTIARHEPDVFDQSIQKIVNILALQITTSLDQADMYERTHRVADRLQRALLPETLPNVPGTRFHWAYRPASDEAEVGGDWYDAFTLPDGRVAISMGDVAGHGLSAATVMGEVRQAMRTTAVFERSPAVVLEHINSVINLSSGIGMVTAIFGYFDPQTRRLTYAVAGHPPPALCVQDGFCGFLPGGGMPLGVERRVDAGDWTITLPPRSGVVFYTDGMTEYARDLFSGEARLLEASARAFAADAVNPALALQERIFDARANRDDAATLTLLCEEGAVPSEMTFSAIPVAAPIARSLLMRFCERHELDETLTFSLITAAGEAIANAVEHAYRGEAAGSFTMRLSWNDETITVEIEDGGRWRPFAPRDERGRGMVLMNELMERVRITSTQKGTNVLLTTRRAAQAPH